MVLNIQQKKQIDTQLSNHNHSSYEVDIELTSGQVLEDFSVNEGVFRSDITSAIYLSRWLFFNNGRYKDSTVIDMGCGPGLQGIVTAIYGASKVVLSDISQPAVNNAAQNVENYKIGDRVKVVSGDLFENVDMKARLLIFNHPFFPEEPYDDISISRSMLGGEDLIHRFLEQSGNYLEEGGSIVMPYFHLAGDTNNPMIQAPKHDFTVFERFRMDVSYGLQQGPFSIYELTDSKEV